ncbi:hypothetical protein OJAV_G00200670 [Oryzias javanicus]|uniref:Uncharacterized protein n=1 Tax=Oryzias javanicus TaxID=123683 RepID=A0A437C9G4_ORYJA|nr:hypothetical protein OJAV_G00200670 [Oryzias javanicus]
MALQLLKPTSTCLHVKAVRLDTSHLLQVKLQGCEHGGSKSESRPSEAQSFYSCHVEQKAGRCSLTRA